MMRVGKLRKSAGLVASIAAAALVFAACGDDNGGGGGGADGGDGGNGGGGGAALDGETITIGVFNGWDEGIAASFLWGHIFEEEGATVEYTFADPGPTFQGVADGTADLSFDAWLPNTHADFWETHGDTVEDFGAWYDEAPLTVAVNEDAPIQSLTELADSAEAFGNQIVGIEPGSGLNRIIREEVIPTYGLEDMKFVESGTDFMLQELENAIADKQDIVVGLWEPHWAYAAFPIRNLEDPEGVLAEAEQIHAFGRPEFSEDYPEVAEWLKGFKLTKDQLLEIEDIMVVQNEAASNEEYAASLDEWIKANPDYIDQLKAGEL